MIQNLIFRILLLKMLFPAYNFFIFSICSIYIFYFLYSFTCSSGHYQRFFFDFSFSGRKSQSQQKLSIKITYFAIQFRLKNLTHFMNLNSLEIENNMFPQHSQNHFWLYYKFFSKHVSVWCRKKTFALHHFLTPKNCILEAPRKQISVYFYILLYI